MIRVIYIIENFTNFTTKHVPTQSKNLCFTNLQFSSKMINEQPLNEIFHVSFFCNITVKSSFQLKFYMIRQEKEKTPGTHQKNKKSCHIIPK